jgi:DinB superfamily
MDATLSGGVIALSELDVKVLNEGYGPGAWHGADFKAALADVTPEVAYWRPGAGRHNIAEIALHHAYTVNSVRGRLSGAAPERFVLEGDDWFDVRDGAVLAWPKILATVDEEQKALVALVDAIDAGRRTSPLDATERLGLVIGITCHAIYHAGQIQLIKRLRQ